jgi:hypothetical protein
MTGISDLGFNDVMPVWKKKERNKEMTITRVKDGKGKEKKMVLDISSKH